MGIEHWNVNDHNVPENQLAKKPKTRKSKWTRSDKLYSVIASDTKKKKDKG